MSYRAARIEWTTYLILAQGGTDSQLEPLQQTNFS